MRQTKVTDGQMAARSNENISWLQIPVDDILETQTQNTANLQNRRRQSNRKDVVVTHKLRSIETYDLPR